MNCGKKVFCWERTVHDVDQRRNIQSTVHAWSDWYVLVWLRNSPADCSVDGDMRLAKNQTFICTCGGECDWTEYESGKKMFMCSVCGEVKQEIVITTKGG